MPTQMPTIGEKFPDIEVETTIGRLKLPEYFKGRWFVLFSHPADFTPVCTTEFIAFALKYEDFKRLNTELIGLSIDSVYSHIKWIEWIREKFGIEIKFPIIADPRGEIASRLGMLHAQSASHTVRTVFIVDDNGIIRAILYYPQEVGRNVYEILRLVKALQISSKYGVALPANWPHNELIKDRAIIPPAKTIEEAKERLKKYECYDWWFCHREVSREDIEDAYRYFKV